MDTIFVKSKIEKKLKKNSEYHVLVLKLTDKLDL